MNDEGVCGTAPATPDLLISILLTRIMGKIFHATYVNLLPYNKRQFQHFSSFQISQLKEEKHCIKELSLNFMYKNTNVPCASQETIDHF